MIRSSRAEGAFETMRSGTISQMHFLQAQPRCSQQIKTSKDLTRETKATFPLKLCTRFFRGRIRTDQASNKSCGTKLKTTLVSRPSYLSSRSDPQSSGSCCRRNYLQAGSGTVQGLLNGGMTASSTSAITMCTTTSSLPRPQARQESLMVWKP